MTADQQHNSSDKVYSSGDESSEDENTYSFVFNGVAFGTRNKEERKNAQLVTRCATWYELPWWQRWILWILQLGPVPNHLAFILDGNRRWASDHNLEPSEGHNAGAMSFFHVRNWCRALGVKRLTAYTMSTHNLKSRPAEQLEQLFALLRWSVKQYLKIVDPTDEHGYELHSCGDADQVPHSFHKLLAKAALKARENRKVRTDERFSVGQAFIYSSRVMFPLYLKELVLAHKAGHIDVSDVNRVLLDKLLQEYESPAVDLLVRTSGEVRYSDFLLWQCAYSVNAFVRSNLPEYNFFHFVCCILWYQIRRPFVQANLEKHAKFLAAHNKSVNGWELSARQREFVNVVEKRAVAMLTSAAKGNIVNRDTFPW